MPRYSLHLTEHARVDLKSIAEYTLDHWGRPVQAAYLAELGALLAHLLDHPEMGRRREDIGHDLRTIPHRQHVVVYQVRGDEVGIVRIIHQRMDVARVLDEK